MNKPIRVLHITEMLQAGGIESFIMNVYRNIDKSKVQFDFLLTRNEKEFYDEEVKGLGGRKLTIDIDKNKNVFIRVFLESIELYKILKSGDYNIIHVHSGTPLRIFYLFAAKFAGVNTRIYHSHSAQVLGPHSFRKVKQTIFSILKTAFPIVGTDYFACSKLAGEWMYTKRMNIFNKVKVIHNGINVDKFKYNPSTRDRYRKKLAIENNLVLGHIGRFTEQKNHEFLIEIFYELNKINPDSRLILIGSGELEENIRKKVEKLNLSDSVIFLGVRDDINNIMQAMDIFILPSHYEGLPVVGVEAQAAGLKAIISDNITSEVIFTDNVVKIPLNKTSKEWAEIILQSVEKFVRKDTTIDIVKNGYDIKYVSKNLEMFYIAKA